MAIIRRCRWAGGCLVWIVLVLSSAAQVEMAWPSDLAPARKEVLTKGMELLKAHPAIPYVEAGADVAGMDCSGAILWLLKGLGIELPRTAHGQYEWLKKRDRLTVVPEAVRGADDPVFASMQPGDLLFWARDEETRSTGLRVFHVHMFLGKEKDGHPVMIGSSDGRGYRGKRMSGFGIVDFHVPKAGSASRIIAFGSPFPAPPAEPSKK